MTNFGVRRFIAALDRGEAALHHFPFGGRNVVNAPELKAALPRRKAAINRRTPKRAGITLTQMLVVISLTSVISMAAISVIITMLRLEGRTTQVWMTQQTLLQLGSDFREDAHAAQSAEITTQHEASTLIFRSGPVSKTVTYVASASKVTRNERDREKLLRTETYRLPESEVRFGAVGSGEKSSRLSLGQEVHLICDRPNAQAINRRTPAPRHEEHVSALLGRDHRFEKRGVGGSAEPELKP